MRPAPLVAMKHMVLRHAPEGYQQLQTELRSSHERPLSRARCNGSPSGQSATLACCQGCRTGRPGAPLDSEPAERLILGAAVTGRGGAPAAQALALTLADLAGPAPGSPAAILDVHRR